MKDFESGEMVYIKDDPETQSYMGLFAGTDGVVERNSSSHHIDVRLHNGKVYAIPKNYVIRYADYGGERFEIDLPCVPKMTKCTCDIDSLLLHGCRCEAGNKELEDERD